MIDQKKNGQFISDIRKEKGLTQRQLAEMIGVSDKAISRWETGRGMPDTSIMPDLCKVLSISINELLSGQRLSGEDYCGKAEDNMVELIKTNENTKKQTRNAVVGTVVGILLLCLFICLLTVFSGGVGMIAAFIDIPSLVALLGIQLIILGAAGCFGDFFRGFGLLFASKKYSDEERALYSERSGRALGFGVKATLFAGGCVVLISFITFLHRLSDPAAIGPYLAIIILTALYACIISLILLVIKERICQFGQ